MASKAARALSLPFHDALSGMDNALLPRGAWILPMIMASMLASWWLYVPVHELFHAWGCLAAGGTVTRLEIDTSYGAVWLAQWFPYISPGSDYAGRLSGFDTGGSDAVYLTTVFFPYLLTVLIGVPALLAAARPGQVGAPLLFGAAVPWACTPFLSLPGDYYEIGSILISRVLSPWLPDAMARWRGDDLFLRYETVFGPDGGGNWIDAAGMSASLLTGTALAFLTYLLGRWPRTLRARRQP